MKFGAAPHSSSVDRPGAQLPSFPDFFVAGERGQLLLGVGAALDVVLQGGGVPGHDPLQAVGDVEGDEQRHGQQHHAADLPGERGPRPEGRRPARPRAGRPGRTTRRGTDAPRAKSTVSTTDPKPTRWWALTTEMAVSTGPAQGTNSAPSPRPEDEPSGVAVGLALGDAGEGSLEEMARGAGR